MNTPGGSAVLVAVVLGGVMGCLDFEQEHEAFCRRNLELCGGANVRPEFVSASQSPYTREGGAVSLRVDARDVYGLGLRFTWSADVGVVSDQQDSDVSSGVRWTAPACVAANVTPTVTVKVTHAGGGTASMQFHIAGVATCPRWSETRGMRVARSRHTATLLPSGLVLVAGGAGDQGPLDGAELYDPATGFWSNTGSMSQARAGHTEALLPSGRVRVTGGYGPEDGVLLSSEEYDPATHSWSETGQQLSSRATTAAWPATVPMERARSGHTTTLLPSGLVLVAGGRGHAGNGGSGDAVLSSAELYDPGVGTWSVVCGVQKPQEARTLTVLPSNKVLVTGGYGGAASTRAQVHDPFSGTCLESSGMAIPRKGHTATVLPSGQVLVAGGANVSPEVYSPVTDTWAFTSNMNMARESHTATVLPSGDVLLVGGKGAKGLLATAELYDPKKDQWVSTGSLSRARVEHSATLVTRYGGVKVLVVGGHGPDGSPTATAELYDPKTRRWSSTGSLKEARARHTATVLPNGQVLVVGGEGGRPGPLATAELYDPETGQWSVASPLAQARAGHTATLLPTNKVLVVGGQSTGGEPAGSELYDPVSGLWTMANRPVMPRSGHLAGVLPSGRVLITGGTGLVADSPEVPEWEVYSP
jgi:N-acetylneuraminic acid mutarotase